MKRIIYVLGNLLIGISVAQAMSAESLEERAHRAAVVIAEVVRIHDNAIPESLLDRAECVATIPNVVRVSFIYGLRFGQGLVSCRVPGGWSAPSFINITGASWGLQAGIESIDLVLVFTRENASQKFSKTNVSLGVDATIAVGPVGRDAHAGTDYQLTSEIYSYSRARGLFVGVSLQGSVLGVERDNNALVYGAMIPANEILTSQAQHTPGLGMEYSQALMTYATRR